MVIYLDLVFLNNFLIDGFLLFVTAWTRKIQIRWWRVAISSAIGAAYVIMMFYPALSFLFVFFVKILFSILMIFVAFGFGGIQNALRNLGVFYFVNFIAAGGLFAFYYFFQTSNEVMNGIGITSSGALLYHLKIGFYFILIGLLFLAWFYKLIMRSIRKRENITRYFAEIKVYFNDVVSTCTGLIDTGNQLVDPLTRTPVLVMEVSLWTHILPVEWIEKIRQKDIETMVNEMDAVEFHWQNRLRLVPYRGVNNGTRFMLAMKPDKVVIMHHERLVETKKVLIGFDGGKLSADESYQAIIHPDLLEDAVL